ncbi:carboxypeptidase-like regulatory domain-containing protein [Psychroserpens sp. BH13MA-6]
MKTLSTLTRKKIGWMTMLLIACISFSSLNAQTNNAEIAVKGIVSDENGPLLGANIALKGSEVGTITSKDGTFTFPKSLNTGDILIISFLGYETKEIKITDDSAFLKIVLASDVVEILGALETNKPYKSKRSN